MCPFCVGQHTPPTAQDPKEGPPERSEGRGVPSCVLMAAMVRVCGCWLHPGFNKATYCRNRRSLIITYDTGYRLPTYQSTVNII